MTQLSEKEANLFNATDTLAQFYEEIESFLSILQREMAKLEFPIRAERLRPGAFTTKNLVRRLPATITTIYIPRIDAEESEDEEEEDEAEDEEETDETSKSLAKKDILITRELKIPFACVWLFEPKKIPTATNLKSPQLLSGVFSDMNFVDKKTGEAATGDSHLLSLSNLVQLAVKDGYRKDRVLTMNCWRPKPMKRYKLRAKLSDFTSQPLLEIDSHEKIRQLASRIASV
jgi:hypothetical protein